MGSGSKGRLCNKRLGGCEMWNRIQKFFLFSQLQNKENAILSSQGICEG
jgi:hypothetical protein